MKQSYLMFTITPVQSFIAQARKTQDLYTGSYMLSYLSRIALERAINKYSATIIFPYYEQSFEKQESLNQSLPNLFVARFKELDPQKLKEIGNDLEVKVKDEFLNIGITSLEKLGLNSTVEFIEQIRNHLQIYWVFDQFHEADYREKYNDLRRYLDSMKNVRAFNQLSQPSSRKCSISSEHNVLFYRGFSNKIGSFITDNAIEIANPKYLDKGEALGALSFVKRISEKYFNSLYDNRFPSTARIALMDAFAQLKNIEPSSEKIFRRNFDEQIIFDLINKQPTTTEIDKDETNVALDIIQKLNKIKVSPYYAIIKYDADNMGKKWLSSPKLKDGISFQEYQAEISKKLKKFGVIAANEIVQEPKGKAVYAGGDDFLGFVNINHLFSVIKELRSQFDSIDFSRFTDEKMTFSAGIVIAHYKTPLSQVLSWVRKMEEAAKAIDDKKDAFGLAIMKHSGEIHQTVYKWKKGQKWIIDSLLNIIEHLRNNFSDTFIRNLNNEFRRLMDINGTVNSDLWLEIQEMMEYEMKRLIKRSNEMKKNNIETQEEYRQRRNNVEKDLLDTLKYLLVNNNNQALENYLSALNIAVFIEREWKHDSN